MITDAFKGILKPVEGDKEVEKDLWQDPEEIIGERVKLKRKKFDELNKMIMEKEKIIDKDLFTKYFQFQDLSDMQESLSKAQSNKKDNGIVKVIKSGQIDLNDKIKKMPKNKTEIKKMNEIVNAAEAILDFHKQRGQNQ